jgi:hypothetical protein
MTVRNNLLKSTSSRNQSGRERDRDMAAAFRALLLVSLVSRTLAQQLACSKIKIISMCRDPGSHALSVLCGLRWRRWRRRVRALIRLSLKSALPNLAMNYRLRLCMCMYRCVCVCVFMCVCMCVFVCSYGRILVDHQRLLSAPEITSSSGSSPPPPPACGWVSVRVSLS